MQYFYIEPEVAGELGCDTEMDTSFHPPRVRTLHYEITGWMGDCLLESFPCLIATVDVEAKLKPLCITGAEFDTVKISIADDFINSHPNINIPAFRWLRVFGLAGKDDFGIADDLRFVVSERVVMVLRGMGIDYSILEPYK